MKNFNFCREIQSQQMKCIYIPPTNERKTTVACSHPQLLTESSRLTGLPHFDRICRASVIVIVMSLDWLVVSVSRRCIIES